MIRDLIVKLRTAADALEALDAVTTSESNISSVRKQIEENIKLNMLDDEMSRGKSNLFPSLKQFKKKWVVTPPSVKAANKSGYSYKGKHWTQRPENKKKVQEMIAKSTKTRAKR